MNRLIIALIAMLFSVGIMAEQAAKPSPMQAKFTTEKQKLSYALGYKTGKSFRLNKLDINTKIFEQGLRTALENLIPSMNKQDMTATLQNLQKQFVSKLQAKRKALASDNEKASKEYLAANKQKPGVKVLPDGVQYTVLVKGKGPKPKATDVVIVNYEGKLIDGTVFDSSYKRRRPATFPVAGLIKGWQTALKAMSVGSTWQVVIPPKLAYGANGVPGAIGPNQALIFKVQLIKIKK